MRLCRKPAHAAILVLIALAVQGAMGRAQSIANTAQVSWRENDRAGTTRSNTVTIQKRADETRLELLHPANDGPEMISLPAIGCHSPNTDEAPQSLRATTEGAVRPGEPLILRAIAPNANRNAATAEQIAAQLSVSGEPSVTATLTETAPDSGVFTGAIPTRLRTSGVADAGCSVGLAHGDIITASLLGLDGRSSVAIARARVLAVTYGFVLDSETGAPLAGARVTLIDAATGQPATVLAEDGRTAWPASVVSGQPFRDGAGNLHPAQPGEFRFPLPAPGTYRLRVEPPQGYATPSRASPDTLALLRRSDGLRYVLAAASFGGELRIATGEPGRADIPADPVRQPLMITKAASRTQAAPGESIAYAIRLRNPDPRFATRGLELTDLPGEALRLRPDTIRLDGSAAAPGSARFSADGRRMVLTIPALSPGAEVTISYAATVRDGAREGWAENRVTATGASASPVQASAFVRIVRDPLVSRMTIVGRIADGPCGDMHGAAGVAGVRVIMEDGTVAVTDQDGRYHFADVMPGNHVVQAQVADGIIVSCDGGGKAPGQVATQFVSGRGGSLRTADFAVFPPAGAERRSIAPALPPVLSDPVAAGSERDWLAEGPGPAGFLFPGEAHNPRAPSQRVAFRHRPGEVPILYVDDRPVSALSLDRTHISPDRSYAVTVWTGIALARNATRLTIRLDAPGGSRREFHRTVHFVSTPWQARLVSEASTLVADGRTRPVIAVRLLDRQGRPVRHGVTGTAAISAPYTAMDNHLPAQSAMTGTRALARRTPTVTWTVHGDDGLAYTELAPTMISEPMTLRFAFSDGDSEIARHQEITGWIAPGDVPWTLVGLGEATLGATSLGDQLGRDAGDDAIARRMALYAKGRLLGRFLTTLSFDTARAPHTRRLFEAIDPEATYTVYADRSEARAEEISRGPLYLRIETARFYALYGDFFTGFDQTVLGAYQRAATGLLAEGSSGRLHARGFAFRQGSRHRRDEIAGAGLSGPYRLSSPWLIPNTESVSLEIRDRFRAGRVLQSRTLTRNLDYEIDRISGTIRFREVILSRDADLNPQMIVVSYEVEDGLGEEVWSAGLRVGLKSRDDHIRLGATALSESDENARRTLAASDLRVKLGASSELRAEAALSRTTSGAPDTTAWLVEGEHRSPDLDIIAYARSMGAGFGTSHQSTLDQGRERVGVDLRRGFGSQLSLVGSAWTDRSLQSRALRQAVRIAASHRTADGDLRIGVSRYLENAEAGETAASTTLDLSGTRRFLGNRLDVGVDSAFAIGSERLRGQPSRQRLSARFAAAPWLRMVGTYELASTAALTSRSVLAGLETTPWERGRATATIGQEEFGGGVSRQYRAVSLSHRFEASRELAFHATLDGNRTIGGNARPASLAASSGGFSDPAGFISNPGEAFTAVTLGADWRRAAWAGSLRGEWRNGDLAQRHAVFASLARELGDGSMLASRLIWSAATGPAGERSSLTDAAISAAYRPASSPIAALGKLSYRDDHLPAGSSRGALDTHSVSGRRVLASLATSWTPAGSGALTQAGKTELGLFLGARHSLDSAAGFVLGGTSLLAGLDLRVGVMNRLSLGGATHFRSTPEAGLLSYSAGPFVAFAPTGDVVVTVGYNLSGFDDRDFAAARDVNRGAYAAVRFKFDAGILQPARRREGSR